MLYTSVVAIKVLDDVLGKGNVAALSQRINFTVIDGILQARATRTPVWKAFEFVIICSTGNLVPLQGR